MNLFTVIFEDRRMASILKNLKIDVYVQSNLQISIICKSVDKIENINYFLRKKFPVKIIRNKF